MIFPGEELDVRTDGALVVVPLAPGVDVGLEGRLGLAALAAGDA